MFEHVVRAKALLSQLCTNQSCTYRNRFDNNFHRSLMLPLLKLSPIMLPEFPPPCLWIPTWLTKQSSSSQVKKFEAMLIIPVVYLGTFNAKHLFETAF